MDIRTLSLVRSPSTDQGTFGHIVIGDELFFTGELPWNDNIHEFSCIPTGKYRCAWTVSEKFPSGTFQVLDVPGRDGIRIHIGNWCGDPRKGWHTDVEGCILLGTVQENRSCPKNGGKEQNGVFNSTVAINRFYELMGDDPFDFEIVEA